MECVTRAQMQRIEECAMAYDITPQRLMENAGSAAAAFIRRTLSVEGRNCLVFCAKGNNGGDGMVVARKLAESSANVTVILLDGLPAGEAALSMYNTVMLMEIPVLHFDVERERILGLIKEADILVDAICGTGFQGKLRPMHREACMAINDAIAAVVSLDVPTGVACDSGDADTDAVRADFTVAFDSRKPVHIQEHSTLYCGVVEVVDIGIPPEARRRALEQEGSQPDEGASPFPDDISQSLGAPESAVSDTPPYINLNDITLPNPMVTSDDFTIASKIAEINSISPSGIPPNEVLSTDEVMQLLPVRARDAHKGDFGRVLCIAGSTRYRGAAVMAALGALRGGAGIVEVASVPEVCAAVAANLPEAVLLPLPPTPAGGIDPDAATPLLEQALKQADAVIFGCGLGDTVNTQRLLGWVLANTDCPAVVDADGINVLAKHIHLLQAARGPVILTPHPGEMARLLDVDIQQVQMNRQTFAIRFAVEHKVVVALKGACTVVASPDGQVRLNETGNPGLAKGGSGDVLAGLIGAFAAQGIKPKLAAACGVHLHGLAADKTAARKGQYAMLPTEILEDLADIFLIHGR